VCVALGWRLATEIEQCVWQDWQTDESSSIVKITMDSSSDVESLDDVTDDTNRTDGLNRMDSDGWTW
jgi:hypothetical protein